jgi:hypothetical protein
MRKILFGVFFVLGGMSGYLVLRGTHSSKALMVVGVIFIVWGLLQIRSAEVAERRANVLGGEPRPPEPRMDRPEIEQWIARELGRLRRPDDLIATVCERAGMNWEDAKGLIKRVQEQKDGAIGRRQSRFAMTYGLPIVIAGLFLLVGSGYYIVQITNGNETERFPGTMYCCFGLGVAMTLIGLFALFRSGGQADAE